MTHRLHLTEDEQAAMVTALLPLKELRWVTTFGSAAEHAAWAEARFGQVVML